MALKRIYLDHNATSPLRLEVAEAVQATLGAGLVNPSSVHGSGRKTRRVLDHAREAVAAFLGTSPGEIIFTSGGTEANQLAWESFVRAGTRITTSRVEHSSILGAAEAARQAGAQVTFIGVRPDGSLDASELETALGQNLSLLSFHHANNETGILYAVDEIAARAKEKETRIHTDAVQSTGKAPVDVDTLGVDYLSFSGHKLGALPGTGVLYVRKGSPLATLWEGGTQERGRRPGTENVPGAVALGVACELLRAEGDAERARLAVLRDAFEREILARVSAVEITGRTQPRLPNTSHLVFDDLDGESLMIAADLEGLDCSTGSACSSGSLTPSHVLLAMGMSETRARGSLRVSLGWSTTEEEIARAVELLPTLVAKVRTEGKKSVKRAAR